MMHTIIRSICLTRIMLLELANSNASPPKKSRFWRRGGGWGGLNMKKRYTQRTQFTRQSVGAAIQLEMWGSWSRFCVQDFWCLLVNNPEKFEPIPTKHPHRSCLLHLSLTHRTLFVINWSPEGEVVKESNIKILPCCARWQSANSIWRLIGEASLLAFCTIQGRAPSSMRRDFQVFVPAK